MPANSEYQRHRLKCSCCGETTCTELLEGVPEGQSGPRLMAFVALLMAYYLHSNSSVCAQKTQIHPLGRRRKPVRVISCTCRKL